MTRISFAFASLLASLAVTAPARGQTDAHSTTSEVQVSLNVPDGAPEDLFSGERRRDVLLAQVLLDRANHSPGVIDGYSGANTRRAIRAYRRAVGLPPGDALDRALLDSLLHDHDGPVFSRYTISPDDVNGPFREIPSGFAAQAKLSSLSYETPLELLAEKFHMQRDFLRALNPDADFGSAGSEIIVVAPGNGQLAAEVARIEVDKSDGAVRALASDGTVLATYPATIGSDSFPSPSGTMQVRAVAPNPTYHFDPQGRAWGPDRQLTIAAGPNNPVGGTWIDLSKEGYGIHGTPEPRLIGKTSSHGCVRLTNWDAEQLAKSVGPGVTVEFL